MLGQPRRQVLAAALAATAVFVLGLSAQASAYAAQPKVNPAARDALCKDSKPQHVKDCRDFCTSWPATGICMLIRSEGRVVGDIWMTAAKLKISVAEATKRVGVPAKHVPWLIRFLDTYAFLPIGWPQSGPFYADVKQKAHGAWKQLLRGNKLYASGDIKGAVRVIQAARDTLVRQLGPGHRVVGLAYNNLANALNTAGRRKEALQAITMAIAIDKAALPEFHGQTATALWTRANIHEDLSNIKEAVADIQVAEKWALESYGKEHHETAGMQITKSRLLRKIGRNDDALKTIKASYATFAKLHGPTANKTLNAMGQHASIASDLDDHATAIRLGSRSLAIRRTQSPPTSRHVTTAIHNLGLIYANARRFADARRMFEEVIPILERVDGPRFTRLATSEMLYGRVLRDVGQFMPALKLFRRCYDRRLKAYGPTHESTVVAANEVLTMMARYGHRENVTKMRAALFQVMVKKYGVNHQQSARAAVNYVQSLAADGDFKQAESVGRKWLPRMLALGDHSAALTLRLKIGEWALNNGHRKAARKDFTEAGRSLNAIQNTEPRDLLARRVALADGLRRLGDLKGARRQQPMIRELAGRQLGHGIDLASNDLALFFTVHDLSSARSTQLQAAFETPRNTLDSVLFWQGLTARAERLWRLLNGSAGVTDAKTRADVAAYRKAVARVGRLRSAAKKDAALGKTGGSEALQEAIKARDKLGAGLSKRFPAFGRVRKMLRPTSKSVCRALDKTRSSLVTYVRWSKPVPNRAAGKVVFEGHYHAVVVTAGCRTKVLDLGPSKAVDARIKTWRTAIEKSTACINKRRKAQFCKRDLKSMAKASASLRELAWDPVDKHLPKRGKKAQRVWIAPDGHLVRVSFAALADAKGRYLIEDHELAQIAFPAAAGWTLPKRIKSTSGAFVAGDIDYTQAAASAKAAAAGWMQCADGKCVRLDGKTKGFSFDRKAVATVRGAKVCGAKAMWQALPATEAPTVAKHLGKVLRGRVTLADGSFVIEPALRGALPGTRVIHLATHGFFSPFKQCVDVDAMRQSILSTIHQSSTKGALQTHLIDPLRLNAVVLSGANLGKAANAVSDGMMSGREVARMDLSGTELVVLSACETGLGEQEAGEGSFGLARSFLLAGAEHVVTSLWQVPSRETGKLFETFYPLAFGKRGQHPATALRNTRIELIKSLRAKGLPHNAWFWAAFQSVSNGI